MVHYLNSVWIAPLQLVVVTVLMWQEVGWSALLGTFTQIAILVTNGASYIHSKNRS